MPRKPLSKALWDTYIGISRQQNHIDTRKTLSSAGRRGAWRRWHRERSIVALLPLVTRLARDVRRMFAPHLDVRDLAQAGAVGLMKAAQTYDPALGKFEAYAYWRARGAIIDSQKRRAYREERHVSLQAVADPDDGWLPAELQCDRAPLADEMAAREQMKRRVARAIEALPSTERYVLVSHLRGATPNETATILGRGVTWTRQRLDAARRAVRRAIR